MESVYMFLLSLIIITATAFANETPNIRLRPGMKVSTHSSLKNSSDQMAGLSCNLYKVDLKDGRLGDSALLASQKSQPFDVESGTQMETRFPAPYDDIKVVFSAFRASYLESDPFDYIPTIQASFMEKNEFDPDYREANFNINAFTRSRILLRGTHNFADTVLLIYQCSLIFNEEPLH